MAVSISVCNVALGELRAPPITDIVERTIEARECARYYEPCLTTLLERFDWSFATRIAPLARLALNGRESEWGYAYALPADVATPKRLVPSGAWGLGTPLPGELRRCPPLVGQSYIVEAGVLYTHVRDAILEYSANDVPETAMTAAFKEALAYTLASRLAVPLRDNREMKADLLKQAEVAVQRAVADDANRQPQRDAMYADEVTMARAG